MRFAMFGAGGIGGFIGGRLAHAGEPVAFIARGKHLEAMRRDGLYLKTPEGDVHVPKVVATSDPKTVGPVDALFFSVKLWDMEAAAESARPLIGPQTVVVTFQNGVEKEDVLSRIFGPEHVLGGFGYISTEIESPGVILKKGELERFVIGERDGSTSARVTALRDVCVNAGIKMEASTEIERGIWEKFVFLSCNAAMTALLRLPLGPIRENPQSRALLLDALREVVAVANAKGVGLPADYAEQRLAFIDTLAPQTRASMAVDLERGNRLEVPWLSGAIVRMGRELGVATPVHRVVDDGLAPLANGRG
jgi:2-dehydropantoate 2-reductase